MSGKMNPVKSVVKFFKEDIWELQLGALPKWKSFLISLYMVFYTAVTGTIKNRIAAQAAALSYTTLLAIGPLLALIVLSAGMFFKNQGEEFVYGKIMEGASFVMPALREMAVAGEDGQKPVISPEIKALIDNVSTGSGKLGVYGTLTIVVTCLLLCVNMENAFNLVWSIERGRSWLNRIAFYWLMMTVGSVGIIFGMTVLTTSQISEVLDYIPIVRDYAGLGSLFAGIGAMSAVLTCFYKFMPSTYVKWRAAFVGGVIVSLALVLNNKLSFIYISYIVKQQSFYGYFAIVPIALFSLYVFWLVILMGAQFTYSIQNIDLLSRKAVWKKMSFFSRQMMSLWLFTEVSEAFYDGKPAPDAKSLAKRHNIPLKVVQLCLEDMTQRNLISRVCVDDAATELPGFKPAVSPDSITLAAFFAKMQKNPSDTAMDHEFGKDRGAMSAALESFKEYAQTPIASKTIRELIGK